ncbi:lignostilbene alpha-beta-dioxygenase [Frankia sp. B2]|uniref:carotenoid oxygenase family protein n=1 Tax=Frankia sp. B2 TaxID=2541730 RepID=UPI00106BB332|nr:carotenoid oxygenase family protein [Frankia sp. B2]TFE31959.1 lignostilbene alpha-beta-dioxygenase [Frankia sp. B2]
MDHALYHVLEPSREYDVELTTTAGQWPAGLRGHAFVVGPSQPTALDFFLTGPGMLTRVDLATQRWQTRRVVTPDLAILGALRSVLPPAELAGLLVGARPAVSHTAPHFFGDRLLLTSDRQRPVEFDPVTFDFKSFLGGVDEYPQVGAHPLFPGVQTTSHPVVDLDDGCLWWCNIHLRPRGNSTADVEGPLWVVRWDGSGALESWHVPGARIVQGTHEVTVTRDYVIFTEIGFRPEPGSVAGRNRTRPHQPFTDIYLVAKRDLTTRRVGGAVPVAHARVPYESFHEFADYAQDGDDITLYVAHSNGWDINYAITNTDTVWGSGKHFPASLRGFLPTPVDASPVGRYVIAGRTGEVRATRYFLEPRRHWGTLLYARDLRRPALERGRYLWQAYWGAPPDSLVSRVVEMYRDHPHRVVPVDQLPAGGTASSVVCIDLETMTEKCSWSFPTGTIGESPVYVPVTGDGDVAPGGENGDGSGDGWLLVFLKHADRTEIQVFDALALDAGPVAVATAPGLKIPVLFHSGYAASIRSVDTGYRRFFADDLGTAWRSLGPTVRRVVADVLDRLG